MLRAWGLCLTVLLGISFSLAYGMADSSFLKDSQWEQGKKFLAEGEARTLLGWIDLEVRKDYASAVKEYTRVIELRPDFAEPYNNLGVAFKKKGDLEKAIVNFNRALELRGEYSEAWSNRGWAYIQQKRWREARSDFEQALKINPRDEGALYGMSQVLREARDYAGAQKALSG